MYLVKKHRFFWIKKKPRRLAKANPHDHWYLEILRIDWKCFRKFVAHYLLKSGPAISDQEKLQHIGHRDLKQTKEYAGDIQTAIEISVEDPEARNQKLVALDKTFPINPQKF